MLSSIATLLASGILALATIATPAAEAPVTTEVPVAAEAFIPEAFTFVGVDAEENARLNAAAACNPRAVVNSVPALRDCVINGKIPTCEYDFEAEDVSFCPDGSLRFRVIIYNDCFAGNPDVAIAEIFVCNCTVESWTCL
jgi:hypothetical protein